MSAVAGTLPGRGGARQEQDFDLNLAPIIDCFTVLIAFVMISTCFASVGVLDAGVMAAGDAPSTTAPSKDDVRVRLDLLKNGVIELKVTDLDAKVVAENVFAPTAEGKPDASKLTASLQSIKQKHPSLAKATLAASNNVPYRDVVATLETIRKTVPGVALGGF